MHKVTKTRTIEAGWTMGVDLGDRFSQLCILDEAGAVVSQERVATRPELLERHFAALPRLRVAMEAGTHSPWVSRLVAKCGHEAIVGNPRRMRSISASLQKSDRVDAEQIARLARSDLNFLSPITHRSEAAQRDLALIHARDALVRTRTLLVQHVRCTLKSCGVLVKKCSAEAFPKRMAGEIPAELQTALLPALEIVAALNIRIRRFDEDIERMAAERYQVSRSMCAVAGVGTLTASAFILTIADVRRFKKSRDVGAYIGLTPRRKQSGASDPQMRITKAGNSLVRRLLVGSAHYILGPFGPDCDLRRFGMKLAARGGKSAKKRAVVAVARKLAVLLHRLWVTGEVYAPLRSKPTAPAPVPVQLPT
jgi:transposase